MPIIQSITSRDVCFALRDGDGTDAVHDSSRYGYAVLELHTDDAALTGHGFAFTLGAGTDLVCRAALELSKGLVGREIAAIMAELGSISFGIANHPQWRWLGPEKGVVSLALASINNACWDLFAKSRGLPLWQLLLSLSPAELVATLDLSHIEDEMTAEQATELLVASAAGRTEREAALGGQYPGYDTSFGWISLSDEEVRAGAVRARDAGFKALKLKVGSKDPERDVRRALLVREAVGEGLHLAVDANQQWSLEQAVAMCSRMAPARLLWVEEPCHPDDIAAHRALHEKTGATVAVGEAIPNRVVFKNFLSAGACQLAQLDPARQAGISECLVIAMMAVRRGVRVTHHVGDMGAVAQHLMPFYRVALNQPDGVFLEHIPHLNDYFVHPPVVKDGAYTLPTSGAVGASMELKPTADLLALGGCTVALVPAAGSHAGPRASSAAAAAAASE